MRQRSAFIGARVKYKLEGEKPSKTFCALEKYNGTQRYVPQLLVNDGNNEEILVTDQKNIEGQILKFYRNLFSNKDKAEAEEIESFLGTSKFSMPKLSDFQKSKMEGKITLVELTTYLKRCKNNVAPGSSGFSFEFYKFSGGT